MLRHLRACEVPRDGAAEVVNETHLNAAVEVGATWVWMHGLAQASAGIAAEATWNSTRRVCKKYAAGVPGY